MRSCSTTQAISSSLSWAKSVELPPKLRTLAITTPFMHGKDVLALQWLLLQRGYFHETRDGEYGPATAQAVYRAKYWLGYRKPDHIAAELLVSYLKHERRLSPLMK